MDIRERIKNVMIDALIETRLEEAKPHHPTDPAGRAAYAANLKKERESLHARNTAIKKYKTGVGKSGPNTTASVMGKKSKAPQPPSEGGNVHSMGVNKGGGEDKAFDEKMEKIDQSNAKFLSKVK